MAGLVQLQQTSLSADPLPVNSHGALVWGRLLQTKATFNEKVLLFHFCSVLSSRTLGRTNGRVGNGQKAVSRWQGP